MTKKEEIIVEDFRRFIKHEAMRMNVTQDVVYYFILEQING